MGEAELRNITRPPVAPGLHPVEDTHYLLATPAINALYASLATWLKYRLPGAIVRGRPRLGKTRALHYLRKTLPDAVGPIAIATLLCRSRRQPSETAFFEDLLQAVGHGFVRSGSPAAKRARLRDYIAECALRENSSRFLLFADDAQRLQVAEYEWLMDVHNELDDIGVALVVILVGQDELKHQRSAFSTTGRHQIIGRFMVHEHQFSGLTGRDDLTGCLEGYDAGSEFPAGSGWSFTRYFVPIAFREGWRLADHADILWDAFTSERNKLGLKGTTEVPMQYFCRAVEYVLQRLREQEPNPKLTPLLAREAVCASGYPDAERWREKPDEGK